jgi:hypothetical protein
VLLLALTLCLATLLSPTDTWAATPGPGWSILSVEEPTNLSAASNDSYQLIVTNIGSRSTPMGVPVTISDTLPPGLSVTAITGEVSQSHKAFGGCEVIRVRCVGEQVPAGDTVIVEIRMRINEENEAPGVPNIASVSGGGALPATTSEAPTFSSEPAPFGINNFSLQTFNGDGTPSAQAGGHPFTVATNLYFNSNPLANEVAPPAEVKDVIVDLPPGFVGDPQITPKCPLYALLQNNELTDCPPSSRIGTIVFEAAPATFRASEGGQTTPVYNMQPTPGFPAEFGFTYLGKAVYMYASAVRLDGQLRLRVTVPGIPELRTIGVTMLFFGNPGERFGEGSTPTPFLTNPVDCEGGPLSATAEVDTWQNPSSQHGNVYPYFAEYTAYPQLTGCNMLQFQPTLNVRPEITQADEPSGYTFTVTNPQNESPFTPGSPELRNATVTLPAGVSLSPAAADGLRTCAATGGEGINIGSGQTLGAGDPGGGEDISNPEATELGAGHIGGDGSPYDDRLYHTAPGHCPAASTIGAVEVETPLLSSPLEGRLYVAQPRCGGAGQPSCTEADALDGNLFGVYLEASGSGSIIKLEGQAHVNPSTGQITTSFNENPQVPFSALRLHFNGGPRATLANPLACGEATTSAEFSAWSSPATLNSHSFSSFPVNLNGAGEACPATPPLTPSLIAQTTNPTAGAFSPFELKLSRSDRQQYLSQISVTTPPGLLAMLSSVPLCDEPQATAGTCSAASEIGTATASAGAGSHPYWVSGHVYLTSGYNGAPFGLTIVVPAQAGPFNLGEVVVRSAITVNPVTSAVTITSAPLPQVIDGVLLRVQNIEVDVSRPGFIFNPTSCAAQQITVGVAGAEGATAQVSNPFTTSGCRSLPFGPTFTVSTQAKTSKANGASLDVRVGYKPGQANIRSVAVTLPKQLPARLTTIQKACLAATFAANPAACPAGSLIGVATARTPVLPVALSGPAYLVSYGGAAFPDVVLILQGDGVRVDLTGNIDIAKGITSSTFASVPDAPITSFELNLPEGTRSALATNLPAKAKGDFCGAKLTMPTTLTAQNGLQVKQKTIVAVGGCPKTKKTATARRGRIAKHKRGG